MYESRWVDEDVRSRGNDCVNNCGMLKKKDELYEFNVKKFTMVSLSIHNLHKLVISTPIMFLISMFLWALRIMCRLTLCYEIKR